MERWIQMQFQIKEREKALEIARNRELFIWMFGFYVVAASGIVSKWVRVKVVVVISKINYALQVFTCTSTGCTHSAHSNVFYFTLCWRLGVRLKASSDPCRSWDDHGTWKRSSAIPTWPAEYCKHRRGKNRTGWRTVSDYWYWAKLCDFNK